MGGFARQDLHRVARRLSRKRSAALIVVRLVQVLALLFAMQLSGLAHRIADAFFHEDCADSCEHRTDRGGDDTDDRECPPGCPSCHTCAHAQAPYTPKAARVAIAPLGVLALEDTGCDSPPTQPERRTLFRPPRA